MITRTTSSQINDSLVNYMASTQSKLNDLTKQMATQKKINSITDDAVAAKAILNAKKDINLYTGYIGNMKNSQFELKAVDDSLSSAKTQAQRGLDIALMASNGTYGKTEMDAFKKEIDGIIETMSSLANTKYGDTYLFGGTATMKQPYTSDKTPPQTFTDNKDGTYTKVVKDAAGNSTTFDMSKLPDGTWQTEVTNPDGSVDPARAAIDTDWQIQNTTNVNYNGTDEKRKILIGDDGLEEDLSIVGSKIFGEGSVTTTTTFDPNTGKSTGEVELGGDSGILASLHQLSAAIEAGDTEAISQTIGGLEGGLDTLSESRATAGIAANRFDNLISAYDNNVMNLTNLKSSLEDADLSTLITEWTAQQYALEASYSISAQMMQTNIMNYI